MGTSNSQCRWVLPFTVSQGAHVSCLSSFCRPKDIKGGVCFPLHLSSSFGRGPYFRMLIWSTAVARTSTFPPPPLPLFFSCWSLSETCTVLFSIFKLVATGEVAQNSLLASALWLVYRSDTPLGLFPGCLASNGALKVV